MHFTKVFRPAFLQVFWGGSEVGNLRLHEVFRYGRVGFGAGFTVDGKRPSGRLKLQ